ncbi:MAG TPA: PAS domain S-box protein, partial [Chitinophagaceae bacterium]|nr:PAS domain S-box protein [Chitinophagaceae bacterium]
MIHDFIPSGIGPELHYTSLFEALPGSCILLQNNAPYYSVLAATPEYLAQTGYRKEAIIGKGIFEMSPANPDDPTDTGASDLRDSLEHVLLHNEPHQLPVQRYDVVGADGRFVERYWKASNKPVFSPDGVVAYIIHTAEEITNLVTAGKKEEAHLELQQAYKKIEEREAALQQFKFTADQASDPFILMREDGTFAYLNKKALEAWGYTEEESKGIRVPDVDPIYNDEIFSSAFERAQIEEIPTFETLHKRKDGHIYPVEVKMGGLTLKGKPHMFAIARDITERKKTEQKIRESEERFRIMANTIPQSVWITDAEGRTEFLNQHWCDYCGELYSNTTADDIALKHLHPEDAPKVMKVFKEAMQTGEPWEVEQRNRSKFGEYRWFLNSGTPYKDPVTGKITKWFGVGIDIHDRKMAEQALRKSEEDLEMKVQERTRELESKKSLLDNIMTNSSNGISVTEMIRNLEGKVVDTRTILANNAAVRFTGLPKEVYLSLRSSELDPNMLSSPYGQTCMKTLETGAASLIQYFLEKGGRWLEMTISKMDDDHLIHIFSDVTTIKEAQLQLERTVEELKRSNQNLEEFAYAASHDLKEPVRKVRFFGDRLKRSLDNRLTDEEKNSFERMDTAAQRMGSLIEDLLSYSQISIRPRHYETVDLNQVINLVLEDLDLEIEDKSATVKVDKLFSVQGHHRQLQQALHNLIGNALKYNKPGVPPVVEVTCSTILGSETNLTLAAEEQQKTFYCLSIKDNGIGFDQQDADRIFNVFTRLHGLSEYKGTGIGLSIVRKV